MLFTPPILLFWAIAEKLKPNKIPITKPIEVRMQYSFSNFYLGLGGSGAGGVMRRCSIVLSWASQKASRRSVSGRKFSVAFAVHGFTYALGSSIVMLSSM